jgi:AcrR family transcriptional regulator
VFSVPRNLKKASPKKRGGVAAQRNTRAQTIELKRQDRRDFILQAATKLFAKRGYEATSMDDLSAATGMNKGTLYYYYTSKADILFDISQAAGMGAIKATTPPAELSAAESLEYVIDAWVRRMSQNWDAIQVYLHEENFFPDVLNEQQLRTMRTVGRQFMRIHYDVIQKGVQTGEFRQVEVRATARTLVSMLVGFSRWRESDRDFWHIVETAKKMMLSWLTAERGARRGNGSRNGS